MSCFRSHLIKPFVSVPEHTSDSEFVSWLGLSMMDLLESDDPPPPHEIRTEFLVNFFSNNLIVI